MIFIDFPCVFLCVCPIISTCFCSSKHLQIQGRWNFGPQGITKTQPWSGQWWDLCPYDTRPFETTIRLVLNSAAEWVEGRNHGAKRAHKQMSQMNQSEQEGVSQEHVEMAGCFPIFPRSSLSRAMYCGMKKWLNSPEGYRFGEFMFLIFLDFFWVAFAFAAFAFAFAAFASAFAFWFAASATFCSISCFLASVLHLSFFLFLHLFRKSC